MNFMHDLYQIEDIKLEILESKHDSKGEQAFYMVGTIEEVK